MAENKEYKELLEKHLKLEQDYYSDKQFYQALEKITLSFISRTDLKNILDTILTQIKTIIPYSSANIMLYTDSLLKVVHWEGYEKYGADNFIRNFSIETAKSGKIPYIIKRKKIEVIPDTLSDPEWRVFNESAFVKSAITAPLLWDGEVIGILSLDGDKPGSFTKQDAEKLRPLISFASAAIHNSDLFHEAQEEIKKRTEAEKKLQHSMKIREVLLREIHHRVKNNLSIIMAMIHMQNDKLYDKYHEDLLEDLEQRIYAISLVHEKLYESEDLSNIDLTSYLIQIIESARNRQNYREDIKFTFNSDKDLSFGVDILVPLGLILNEAVSNSLKYAFPDSGGDMLINVTRQNGLIQFYIKDSGKGFPSRIIKETFEEENTAQGGLNLIMALTSQINGTISFSNDGGAVIDLSFPC